MPCLKRGRVEVASRAEASRCMDVEGKCLDSLNPLLIQENVVIHS